MLCKVADKIRLNLWINTCNFDSTRILTYSWCYILSLALKPTFLNMNLPIVCLDIYDFIQDGNLNFETLSNCLSSHFDSNKLSKMVFDSSCPNQWVWPPLQNSLMWSIIFIITKAILKLKIGKDGIFYRDSM